METFIYPAIRFPEFSQGWKLKKLGELFRNRRQKGRENLEIYSVTQDRGLVPRSSLERKMNNDAKAQDNLYVQVDDLVYNMMRMWQGAIGKANNQCMVSPAYIVLQPHENANSTFYLYFFERSRSKYLFTAYSYGLTSDRLRLYYKDFSDIKFFSPALPEQQKIASFLTAVDSKLQALKKKKELLEQYKKGIMQKLFSQELRFKPECRPDENGKDFPDWEKKKLGEVGETYNGLTGKTKENFGKGKPYIQYKQIFDDSKIDISRFELVEIGVNENQNQVIFGDVFFTVSSETPNEIGTASVLLDKVDEVYLNSFCFGYRANSLEIIYPYFSQYLFRSELFRKDIVKLAQGSTRYNMSKVQLIKLEIKLPCIQEQTKIANFLSAIDQKIDKVSNQIQQTAQWKKGLLQRMFV